MGFLLRENSYLLKCYPTIKVFCGLAVKQRGPEVEITGFSFWLRHKFPLSELWASPFITACVTLAVPLLGQLVGAGCAIRETPVTLWRDRTVADLTGVLCLCRRCWQSLWCQHFLVWTPREMFLLCPAPGVWEPFLWRVLSSAMPCSGHCSLGFPWALALLSDLKSRPWLRASEVPLSFISPSWCPGFTALLLIAALLHAFTRKLSWCRADISQERFCCKIGKSHLLFFSQA